MSKSHLTQSINLLSNFTNTALLCNSKDICKYNQYYATIHQFLLNWESERISIQFNFFKVEFPLHYLFWQIPPYGLLPLLKQKTSESPQNFSLNISPENLDNVLTKYFTWWSEWSHLFCTLSHILFVTNKLWQIEKK